MVRPQKWSWAPCLKWRCMPISHDALARRSSQQGSVRHVLHRHTDGNPFFLVTVVDDLVQQEEGPAGKERRA